MKTMKWLLKREIWENRGLLIYSNLVLAGILVIISIVMAVNVGVFWQVNFQVNGVSTSSHAGLPGEFVFAAVQGFRLMFSILLPLVVYGYCVNCLSDERKSKSILFWKSLPVSDGMTVVSKLIFALVLLPLASVLAWFAASLVFVLMAIVAYALHGTNVFSDIFLNLHLWGIFWQALTFYPLYLLWALPSVAWLMLISSLLRNRPGMWALLIPIGILALTAFVNNQLGHLITDLRGFAYVVVYRSLFSIAPGAWNSAHGAMSAVRSEPDLLRGFMNPADFPSYELFYSADLWLGVLAAAVMILAAVRIRRWQE